MITVSNSKNKSVARIVIWSVVIVVLAAILIAAIFGGFSGINVFNGINIGIGGFGLSGYRYEDADKYLVGGFTLSGADAADIRHIDIDWPAGNITLDIGEDEMIVEEDSGLDSDSMLRYKIEDGCLTIKYRKSGFYFFNSVGEKDLTVTIPKELALDELKISLTAGDLNTNGVGAEKITVENVSGEAVLDGVSAVEVKLETVSGDFNLSGANISELDAETVSGGVKLSGSVKNLKYESVSGNLRAEFDNAPDSIDINTISGGADIFLPVGTGLTVSRDTVSSHVSVYGDRIDGDGISAGDGVVRVDIESVSGDVSINEK